MTSDSGARPGHLRAPQQSTPRCRLLLIDDNRLYREALVQLLVDTLGFDTVEEADSLPSVQLRLASGQPDVVIVNLATRHSREILSTIAERRPGLPLVAVGVNDTDERQVLACAEAGVNGYVTRDDSVTDFRAAIHAVAAGGSHVSPRISSLLLRRVREAAVRRQGAVNFDTLTAREIQILRLIGAGLGNQDIARKLTIELHTVKNHVHNLLTKLGVRSRGEAAALLTGWDRLDQQPASVDARRTQPVHPFGVTVTEEL